jgi:sialidase-1
MEQQVLAVRGVGGYRQYRIPAMAVTPTGRIITIYDARLDFDDLPGPVDLVIRFSDDNGITWSEQEIFRKHEGISGFGDASIIIDPNFGEYGRIIVLYQWTKNAGFFESILGTEIENPLIAQIARSISDDNGVTWHHDVITDQLKDEKTPGIFATSGMGGLITNGKYSGRLLQTFVLRREFELSSAIGFSDDHGATWRLGAHISGGNETAIVGLQDGTVLLHSRATPHRIVGRSVDGGETLVSLNPDLALLDPSDNGSLAVLRNGDVICTHNHDNDLRRNTIIKRSVDNGITWSWAISVEKGSSAYSTACELSDSSIGILYERNAYQEIVFAKYLLSDFQSIEEVIDSSPRKPGIEFSLIPRYIRPGRDKLVEDQIISASHVPEVDMSGFNITERKEVGPSGGTTSGDAIYTAEELLKILGPVAPGFHVGDEIRFSARVSNNSSYYFRNLEITDRDNKVIFNLDELAPMGKEAILDIRQEICDSDVPQEVVRYEFKLRGFQCDSDGMQLTNVDETVCIEMATK